MSCCLLGLRRDLILVFFYQFPFFARLCNPLQRHIPTSLWCFSVLVAVDFHLAIKQPFAINFPTTSTERSDPWKLKENFLKGRRGKRRHCRSGIKWVVWLFANSICPSSSWSGNLRELIWQPWSIRPGNVSSAFVNKYHSWCHKILIDNFLILRRKKFFCTTTRDSSGISFKRYLE